MRASDHHSRKLEQRRVRLRVGVRHQLSQDRPLVALSIFAGLGLVAVAVYLALAPRAVAPVSPVPTTAVAQVPTPPSISSEQVSIQVAAALGSMKEQLSARCWAPAIARDPAISTSRYVFQITINEQGHEIGRGVSDLRNVPSRGDVGTCLRAVTDLPIQIAPPGRTAQVELNVDFP